ncbi:TniQ family protein [Chitinimonas viridis]|nr:TniQ family protein [Chitinimonas viridis]
MPDELAAGLAGRLARLNGSVSTKQLLSLLKLTRPSDGRVPAIWVLANTLSLDPEAFAAEHTMLPLRYPISAYVGVPEEAQASKQRAFAAGLTTGRTRILFCTECAREDERLTGFSHWRRRHQIEGLDWCEIHRRPLQDVDLSATDKQPHVLIDAKATGVIDKVELDFEQESQTLHQLHRIQFAWLSSPEPIALQAWSDVIARRCEALGLRRGEVGKRNTASDLIRDRLPASWLRRHMPAVLDKKPSQYLRKIDGACIDKHVAYPSLACAALLASLFDTADDALEQLRNADTAKRHAGSSRSDLEGAAERHALGAFLNGLGLHDACVMHDADVSVLEAHLRVACGRGEAIAAGPVLAATD